MPLNDKVVELAELLLSAPDTATRAALVASAITQSLPDSACVVYRFVQAEEDSGWMAIGLAGDISIEQRTLAASSRLIAPLLSGQGPLVYPGAAIRREDFSHLGVPRSLSSLAYLPLHQEGEITGAVEILSFAAAHDLHHLEKLAPFLHLASPAILAAEHAENERETLLDSVHRMSQLYDLEKSLNATLDFDALIEMIPEKAAAMLPCQAFHLWLFEGSVLRLVSSHGLDGTIEVGMTQAPGEGYVADMAEDGDPVLIDDENDARLVGRNAVAGPDSNIPPISNGLLVALIQDGAEVGVLEAINREEHPFDEDDQFFLSSMAETISSALKNASLMISERKLEILEALARVSTEITSTLRLDRLLQIIVNDPQNVLPYQLSAIALDHRGRLQLKAVSGMSSLPLGDIQVERMHELVRWLSSEPDSLHLKWREESDPGGKADLPSVVARHFDETGYRALFSLPLTDDQGRVGLLLYESSNPDFLDQSYIEMIKVLAGQATVAVRNAMLYREVPLIGLIEPLIQKRAALLRTSGRRRLVFAAVAAAVALFLIFCPLPMRITGNAVVAPQHLVTVAAPVDGNVEAVFVHEGQRVAAGEVLGKLNDWQWRSDLATAESRYQQAELTMENDLAHGAPQAGADRTQTEFLRSELARARSRLDSAQLRSPIAGIVVTPNLQNLAGQHLDVGAAFAQVLDLNTALVQVAIPQRDASLVASGQPAAIKLDSYPQRTWRNRVSVLGPEAQAVEGERIFNAEVSLENTDAVLRAGMSGKAKIYLGWRPAGFVLLRGPALWLWQTLWNWIGW